MIHWRSHVGLSTYLSNLPESKIDQSGDYGVQCWVLLRKSVKLWQSKTCRLMVGIGWLDSKLKLIESSGSLASNLTWTNPWTPLDWCSKIVYWRNTPFLHLSMSQTICVITILSSKFIEDWWCHAIVGRVRQFESYTFPLKTPKCARQGSCQISLKIPAIHNTSSWAFFFLIYDHCLLWCKSCSLYFLIVFFPSIPMLKVLEDFVLVSKNQFGTYHRFLVNHFLYLLPQDVCSARWNTYWSLMMLILWMSNSILFTLFFVSKAQLLNYQLSPKLNHIGEFNHLTILPLPFTYI